MTKDLSWPVVIPRSDKIVGVGIIDTTTRMGNIPASHYQGPDGSYPMLTVPGEPTPSYSFLITHEPSRTMILFDLGLRKDWETTSAPAVLRWIRDSKAIVSVEKDVATVLKQAGVNPQEIDAVIYSHQHFDHTGNPNTLSARAKIVVGPGYKSSFLPGWPANKKSWDTTSDLYRERTVIEVTFSDSFIGGLQAYDYFGDGSFYLLNSPGHTVAHLSALARTTAPIGQSDQSTFILLGGDIAHSPALFRPSIFRPLPGTITLPDAESGLIKELTTEPFLEVHHTWNTYHGHKRAPNSPYCTAKGPHHDLAATQDTIDKLSALDAMDNVLTVLAHDKSLLKVVNFFPEFANDWRARGWSEKCRWAFISDFRPLAASQGNAKL